MNARDRAAEIVRRLEPEYGNLSTGLSFEDPLQLLVATILSAQCTDERVNLVTPALFSRYRSVTDFAIADLDDLQAIIQSCGFYRNKAKNIRGAANAMIERFDGQVPRSMKELITLPGVARKTANVVLAHAYGINEGIAVDTHVLRLSRRLGLSTETDPVKVERDLMTVHESETWGRVSDLLIWHGRKVCVARTPACSRCLLIDICPSATTG